MMLTELDMQFIEVAAREIEAQQRGKRNATYVPVMPQFVIAAASLHGRLLERNGVRSVDEIVAATSKIAGTHKCVMCGALYESIPEQTGFRLLTRQYACSDCRGAGGSERITSAGFIRANPFDVAAFFRAVAIEAMGGAKVAKFTVTRFTDACLCIGHPIRECTRHFSVPSIKQEAQS